MNIDENIPNGIDDLDTSWLDEFDKLDNEYKNYYNEEQLFIRIKFVYININSEINQIKEEKYFFRSSNKISKDELISLIKKNSFSIDKTYSLLSILKFTINIQPLQIKNFLKNTSDRDNNFLESIKNIDDIIFEKSISMFHDINELFIIFFEKQRLNHVSNQSSTKKLFINPNTKKYTRRKQFKASQIL